MSIQVTGEVIDEIGLVQSTIRGVLVDTGDGIEVRFEACEKAPRKYTATALRVSKARLVWFEKKLDNPVALYQGDTVRFLPFPLNITPGGA